MFNLGLGSIASSSKTIFRQCRLPAESLKAVRPSHRSSCQFRHINNSAVRSQGQALGRITPKRIAIPLPPGSGAGANGGIPEPNIWRPVIFCLIVGGGGYILEAEYTNSDTAKWCRRLGSGEWWRMGKSQPTDQEIHRAKTLEGVKSAQASVDRTASVLSFLPQSLKQIILRTQIMIVEYELNTPPASSVPMTIIAGFGVIALYWNLKRFQPFMRRWFLHHPVVFSSSARAKWQESLTLLTSIVSHQSLPHLAFNSIAFLSFGGAAYSFLSVPPPETSKLPTSTNTPHFLAFLLCAGLFSSLGSHLWTNLLKLPRLLRILNNPARISSPKALAANEAILPSLGASGAIYAAVTLTACAYPDSSVSIIFLPFIPIPIGTGVSALVCLDIVGLIRGWRAFDHVAHLSGALFGVIYYQYGRQVWLWVRRTLGAEETKLGLP